VLTRLERLGPDAVALAQALAVLGSQYDVGVAAELADAEAQARWAVERATGIFAVDALAHLIEILIERDALADAEDELSRVRAPLDSHSIVAVTYLMARGRLRAAQGRRAEALQDFLACGERCERLGIALAVYPWRSEAAIANASLGRPHEARRLAGAEVTIARRFGRPRALGVALRSQGLAQGGERGLALLAEAVAVLERSQAPVELARALTDYGAALRRAGQRGQARAQLERGLDLAHHWGARRIAGQARAELVAAGAKPRRDAMTGRDALTASELRVARLAAEGKTNREIAQTLFITTKTASAHLSRVYRKLGVTRRNQLAQALVATAPARDEPARIRGGGDREPAADRGRDGAAAAAVRRPVAGYHDGAVRGEAAHAGPGSADDGHGATVVILPRFELETFLRAVADHRITRVEAVPPMVLGLAGAAAAGDYDLSSLRLLTSAAAPLSVDLARACARRIGCRVKQIYGMTEVSGGTHIPPDDGPDRPESIGPPLPGVECRVVDPETGADLGSGQPGELLVRTPSTMIGYRGDPEATAAILDPAGWRVAPYKRVRQVEFTASIPKSPAGKILRRQLTERASQAAR
jgi:DNA-binding CsgD family transcriptional regulator